MEKSKFFVSVQILSTGTLKIALEREKLSQTNSKPKLSISTNCSSKSVSESKTTFSLQKILSKSQKFIKCGTKSSFLFEKLKIRIT